jgi:hypothetical protein
MRVTFGFYQHIFPLGADGLSGGSLMVAARYLVVLLDVQFFGGQHEPVETIHLLAEMHAIAGRLCGRRST